MENHHSDLSATVHNPCIAEKNDVFDLEEPQNLYCIQGEMIKNLAKINTLFFYNGKGHKWLNN